MNYPESPCLQERELDGFLESKMTAKFLTFSKWLKDSSWYFKSCIPFLDLGLTTKISVLSWMSEKNLPFVISHLKELSKGLASSGDMEMCAVSIDVEIDLMSPDHFPSRIMEK